MEEKRGLAYLQDELRKMGHTKPSRESKAVKDVVRILARDDGWISEAASDLLDEARQMAVEAEERETEADRREHEASELIASLKERALAIDARDKAMKEEEAKLAEENESIRLYCVKLKHLEESVMSFTTEAGREKFRLAKSLEAMVEVKTAADNTAYIKALGNILAGAATKDAPRKGA